MPIETSNIFIYFVTISILTKHFFIKPMSYPRTPHLPFSPSIFSDDIINKNVKTLEVFENKDIVILEKIDGANCCIHPSAKKVYARTHSFATKHPSFSPIKEICEILYCENIPKEV